MSKQVVKCLKENETCPDGYFFEWVVPQSNSKLKALAGKLISKGETDGDA